MTADFPAATCFDCGYDLRGLPLDGRCPECGLPAEESARRRETLRLLWVAATGILAVLVIGGLEYAVDRWRWRYVLDESHDGGDGPRVHAPDGVADRVGDAHPARPFAARPACSTRCNRCCRSC